MITDNSKKHLARILRRRLEGRVPAHILNQLSDDQLVDRYNAHHASKLQAVRDRKAAQEFKQDPEISER